MFEDRALEAYEIFSKVNGITVTKAQGAFYMSIIFNKNVLNDKQFLEIETPSIRENIEARVKAVHPDKRFVYYLLGATGICVVPMTGFCCTRQGFRITLLECDDEKRRWTWNTIADAIRTYTASA